MRLIIICAALTLAACGPARENDRIYQALKADPPTEIPARHLGKLRRGMFSCDVLNEGRADQYMICYWPQSYKPTKTATLTYYAPNFLRRPKPSMITVRGGASIAGDLAVR